MIEMSTQQTAFQGANQSSQNPTSAQLSTGNGRHQGPSTTSADHRESQVTNGSPWNEQKIAMALGWFSIGLGTFQLLAPNAFNRMIGVRRDCPLFVRLACGARELAAGVGILTQTRPAGVVWSRVAGDAFDLALLGAAMTSEENEHDRLALAAAAVAGVTALDVYCAQQLSRDAESSARGAQPGKIHVKKTITVNSSPEELYRFWHNYENFPQFMKYLESVKMLDNKRSHWVAKGPLGKSVEWDAETTSDIPNQEIAWRTLPDSHVYHEGSVRFQAANGGRGTRVSVDLHYSPPGGLLGAGFAKLFGKEPQQEITQDLFRFKQLIETGEIPTTKGQSTGKQSPLAFLREDQMGSR
jgi:uncharacterized membrane protein